MKITGTKKRKDKSTAMGMAASQARFLGLTARKNNVEFEGQQVNQQRTTLSNQSANYYNDLLGMSVPVPPSVDDYTKTVYTFEDGALTNQITAMMAQNNGDYTVSYLRTWNDDFSIVSANSSIVNANGEKTVFKVGSATLRTLGDTENPGNDEYLNSLSEEQLKNLSKEEQEYLALLEKEFGPGEWLVRYIKNSTTGEYSPYFYRKDDLTRAIYEDETGNSQSNINSYTIGSKTKTEEVKALQGCKIEKDSSGRYINISIPQYNSDGTIAKDASGNEIRITYALTTSTVTDQEAYDDAMNQYEYEKYEYDQAIQEINAKIEIIQAEDKNLELRLKQLDTEQKAISTEIDAVSQVIQKNTESSFKTFG